MKRFYLIVAALLAGVSFAMASSETVFLKNGSVIKGEIIEQVPGQSIKVKTNDGSIFVFANDEIERISKESTSNASQKGHKGLDFSIASGINVMSGTTSVPLEFILSKQFHRNLSVGLGAGLDIPTGDGKPLVPLFADFKGLLPLSSTSIVPMLDVRLGYAINTADDETVGSGKYRVTVKQPNYIVASIMPGIRIPLSYKTDLDFGLGYMLYSPASGGGKNINAFGVRLGLNFHKSTNPNQMPKEPVPIRNTGFEFGFDAFGTGNYGLNLLLGYRLSKKLSVGLGVGLGAGYVGDDFNYDEVYYSEAKGKGNKIEEKKGTSNGLDGAVIYGFLRGEYRLTTRKFSPIVNLDLGFRKHDGIPEFHIAGVGEGIEGTSLGFFARPSVGMSWRTTNNSYLSLSVGYEFGSGFGSVDKTIDRVGSIGYNKYESVKIKSPSLSMNNIFIGLTWKHTFKWFSRD